MRHAFAAVFLSFFTVKPALALDSFTLREACSQDICVGAAQQSFTVELYPIPSSTDTYVWIRKDTRGVSLKIANKSAGAGYVCVAVREESGNLVSVPGRFPVAEKLESYQGTQKVEFTDWLTGTCTWLEFRRYVFFVMNSDKTVINLLGQAGRPSLVMVVAFFPATDFLGLDDSDQEPDPKKIAIQSESASNVRVLSGGDEQSISPQIPRRKKK